MFTARVFVWEFSCRCATVGRQFSFVFMCYSTLDTKRLPATALCSAAVKGEKGSRVGGKVVASVNPGDARCLGGAGSESDCTSRAFLFQRRPTRGAD